MSGSSLGWHRSWPFKSYINIFLGVDSCVEVFTNHTYALVCIHVGECPTPWRFLASYSGRMATYLGLDQGTSIGGCCISWFMLPSIPMDVD